MLLGAKIRSQNDSSIFSELYAHTMALYSLSFNIQMKAQGYLKYQILTSKQKYSN